MLNKLTFSHKHYQQKKRKKEDETNQPTNQLQLIHYLGQWLNTDQPRGMKTKQ